MEFLYIVISLNEANKEAFSSELTDLFPSFEKKKLHCANNVVLLCWVNLEEKSKDWTYAIEHTVFIDENVKMFSRKHPYLSIGVINKLGEQNTVFYDGYIIKNKNIIFEYANINDGYIPLLHRLIDNYDETNFFE